VAERNLDDRRNLLHGSSTLLPSPYGRSHATPARGRVVTQVIEVEA